MVARQFLNKLWRMQNCYSIVNKTGVVERFKLNNEQLELFKKCENIKASGKTLRLNILKARQIGITTFYCIYYLDEVVTHKNHTAAIIAHEREALEKIFRKIKFAYESMPEAIKPRVSLENKRELLFPGLNSGIYIALKIRSGTVQHLHVSEKAYIDNPEELKAGSYQAAQLGDITNESTANGLNHFYSDWQDPGIWENVFFPWSKHKGYVSRETIASPYDIELKAQGLSQEQINWWNQRYFELNKDIFLMKREYPNTEHEAFETANRGIFLAELDNYKIDLDSKETIKEPNYTVQVFAEPIEKEVYTLGADPAGGYIDGDKSCFYILNTKTRDIVVEWCGTIAPDLFGKEIIKWATKYNIAFVIPEVNNHGLSVINAIKDEYSEIYRRERRDTITNETKSELGWQTNSKTKDEMIDNGKRALREIEVPALPKSLKMELRTFVRKEDGSTEAEQGCHDDRVIAFLLALMGIAANPAWQFKEKPRVYMGRTIK